MSTLKQKCPEVFEFYMTYPPMLDRASSCAIDLEARRMLAGVLEALATTEDYNGLSCQFDAFAVWLYKTDTIKRDSTETMAPIPKEAQDIIVGESQTLLDALRCIEVASHRIEQDKRITNALVVELNQLYSIFNRTLLQ